MAMTRPYVLSIAGFDPSGGAGILADIKTFESNKVYGLGAISANTFQNDTEFKKADWISLDEILEQVGLLKERFSIEYIKIGLIENLEVLDQLISQLQVLTGSKGKIIWDPILRSSSGFGFHEKVNRELVEKICGRLYLLTPNIPEALELGRSEDAKENAKYLSRFCNVYLKGGHSENDRGRDFLFTREEKQFSFRPKAKTLAEKHGSGCILSSAITANLARGFRLHTACMRGKQYTERTLNSNKTLLAYHRI
ncbi:MAG: hydroxymethylpyrimidine/phosphomethylpyrimidine kinase [Bacteroidia bacterium]